MAHIPDIKPEVNKVDDGKDKKKASGLLGSLFGGGGAGSGAAGGLGGAVAAGGGGLLATKAGLIGLIVVGSAVAGGIGLVGYSAFGPGEGDKAGGNLSLFAPKPKEADPNAPAPVAKDGSSASLNYFAQAAKQNTAGSGSGEAAPADQTAGDSAASGDASAAAAVAGNAAGNTPINSGGGAGATGSMGPGLQGAKKLGELSKASGGGASSSASASTKGPGSLLDGVNSSRGALGGGFAKAGGGGAASLSSRRGVASRKGGKTGMRQLASVLRDKGSGATYDGGRGVGTSAGSLGEIGPDGGAIGVEGAGAGSGGAQPTSTPNSAPNVNEFEPPEPKKKHMVTPWEKALNMAMLMVGLAGGLMVAASMLLKDATPATKTWTLTLAKWLLGIAVVAAVAALAFGGMVAFGKHGQALQGGLMMLAAAAVGSMAGYMLSQIWGENPQGDKMGQAASEVCKEAGGSTLVTIVGGAAAVAVMGSMLVPKKQIEKSKADGTDIGYYQTVKPPRYTA